VIIPTRQNKGEYLLVGDNTNKGKKGKTRAKYILVGDNTNKGEKLNFY